MSFVELVGAETEDPLEPTLTPATARLGIGALSKATGIPVETLRTWERRYGFPAADRDAGGQRTYDLATRQRLTLVKQAVDRGLRAARVVAMPLVELERLLADAPDDGAQTTPPRALRSPLPGSSSPTTSAPWPPAAERDLGVHAVDHQTHSQTISRWLELVARLDGLSLSLDLYRVWSQLGTVAFLDDLAGPWMGEVGRQWADGRLSVAHEHFATEQLRARLPDMGPPGRGDAPTVLCATLPGELHSLGLEMATVVLRQAGLQVIHLGSDVPLGDLARAIHYARTYAGLRAVSVSMSASTEPVHARNQLSQLRSLVAADVAILCGGAGAPTGVAGVVQVGSMRALQALAESLLRGQAPAI